MIKKAVLFIAILLLTSFSFAEIIKTKSGKIIEGKIVERTNEYIKADIGIGMPITYFLDEIESIKETSASETPQEIKEVQATGGEAYVNEKKGFSLEHPIGWLRKENVLLPTGTYALLMYNKGVSTFPTIAITEDSILAFPDVENVMDFTKKMWEKPPSGFRIMEEPKYMTIAGIPATKMTFAYPGKYENEDVIVIWNQVLKDNTVFTFSLTDKQSSFEKNKIIFNKMVESVKFFKTDTQSIQEGYSQSDANRDLDSAVKLAERGDFNESILLYEKASTLEPVAAYQGLAFIYFNLQRYNETIKYCKKVLEINPHDGWSYYHIGTAHTFLGETEQALEWLKKAATSTNIEPGLSIWVYHNLGTAYRDMGNILEAKEAFNKAFVLAEQQNNTTLASELKKKLDILEKE